MKKKVVSILMALAVVGTGFGGFAPAVAHAYTVTNVSDNTTQTGRGENTPSTAIEISEGDVFKINMTEDERVIFKFTPTETGTYSFYSSSDNNADPSASVYDENKPIGSSEDNEDDPNDVNFYLSKWFEAGHTVYFDVYLYGDANPFEVHLEAVSDDPDDGGNGNGDYVEVPDRPYNEEYDNSDYEDYSDYVNPDIFARSEINKQDVSNFKAETYTGKAIKPAVAIAIDGEKLVKDRDYTVSYKNNKNVGTATVTIKGIGDYTGTVKKTFKINPKTTSISKVKAGKKSATIKWKKQAKQTTGYQVQYSTKKNFKSGVKTVNIKKAKTTSKKISKLKAGKKYYVRVRTYKTVSGKKYYSSWSKVKSVTV